MTPDITPEELAKILFEIGQMVTIASNLSHAIPWELVPDDVKSFKVRVAQELLKRYELTPIVE